jgi:microcompartment protein CcmK/EutM
MRIGRVKGTVTLSHRHASMAGGRFKIVVPLSLADLQGVGGETAEELVVYDEWGAGVGHLVAFSEGREAAQPFHPEVKPVDAYCAAILDQVVIHKPSQQEP